MNGPALWLEDDPAAGIAAAASTLRGGGTVIFPTDTVYGLLAASDSQVGYLEVFSIKRRSLDKPLALLAGPGALARQAAALLAGDQLAREEFANGALTLLLDPQLLPDLPRHIPAIQPGTVGLRLPQHPQLVRLIGQLGGLLWATSANESSSPPAAWAAEVQAWLAGADPRPRLVVLSRAALGGTPSRVAELHGGKLLYQR